MVARSDMFERLHGEEGMPGNRLLIFEKSEPCFDPWGEEAERGDEPAPDWTAALTNALHQFADAVTERREELARVQEVEEKLRALSEKVEVLEEKCEHFKQSFYVPPIQTFGDEPFELIKPILVSIQESDGEYIASFFDANISTQGCTQQEALDSLKDLLLSRFEHLDQLPVKKLGKSTRRQIAVLREFIRRSK